MTVEEILAKIERGVDTVLQGQKDHGERLNGLDARVKAVEEEMARQRAVNEAAEKRFVAIEDKAGLRGVTVPGLEDEAKRFQWHRAFRAIVTRDFSDAPFEREVFDASRKRAMAAGVDTAGGYLVPNEILAEIIPLLSARAVARMLGVPVIGPLTGSPVQIAKITGGATHYWVGENQTITASDIATGMITVRPHQSSALIKMSNRLIQLAPRAAEGEARRELVRVLALGEDKAFFLGTGADTQPLGITKHPDKLSGSLATLTYAKWVDFVGKLEDENVAEDRIVVAFSPGGKRIFQKLLDTDGRPVFFNALQSAGQSARRNTLDIGYPFAATTQLSSTDVVAFSTDHIFLAEWGGLMLSATQEAGDAFAQNQTWIRAIHEIDVGVRHGQAIVYANDLSA